MVSKVLAVVLVVVAALTLWLGWVTGGFGLVSLATALGVMVMVRAVRGGRRRIAPTAFTVLVGVFGWNLVSAAAYVLPDNGESYSTRLATWGRNHGLGPVIDELEAIRYREPPSAEPADELGIDLPMTTSTTAPPTNGAPSTSVSVTTTTVPPGPQPPDPLTPVISPALQGEGQWFPVAQADGYDAMWVMSMRPTAATGGIVATLVAIDQTHLRTAMFNGTEEPGGGPWRRGDRVPKELQPFLVATMNGGFRFDHIDGGYMNEGVVAKPLLDGDATLAIDRNGVMRLGVLGRDIVDDGSWESLRQNLWLIVDNGRSNVQAGIDNGVWWGADFGNEVYVKRSGVCELSDGRLAYALVDQVDAEQFAQALVAVGCVRAMQLDINADWPSFLVYDWDGDEATGTFVDKRLSGYTKRYLQGSTKEFFAFFDSTELPKDVTI